MVNRSVLQNCFSMGGGCQAWYILLQHREFLSNICRDLAVLRNICRRNTDFEKNIADPCPFCLFACLNVFTRLRS